MPWSSGLGPSHPCAKCGEYTAGIAIGGLCANCTRVLERRAGRIARPGAIGPTAGVALYFALELPGGRDARPVGGGGGGPWCVVYVFIVKLSGQGRVPITC